MTRQRPVPRAPDDNARNTELLNAELPDTRWRDDSYLHWLYDQNPHGPGIYANGDDEGRRVAHYAVVPQEYRSRSGPVKMVFSLNAVTRSGGQRRGWFTQLGEEIYAAAAAWGAHGVIGVSNVNSTPPVVRKLDFRLLGPLPVMVAPFVPGRQIRAEHRRVSHTTEHATGGIRDDGDWMEGLEDHPADAFTNRYTPEHLRWRLDAPNMASPYFLHRSDDLLAVSALHKVAGRSVAVILKLLPRAPFGGGRIEAGPLISAVCRYHRSPLAVYAGFNRWVRVRGIRPPRRVQPVPLNLIYRSLHPAAAKHEFRLDTFEFLDMDAY